MPEVKILATGEGDYWLHDPDARRAWMRDRKQRELVDQTTTAADAGGRSVAAGDCVSFDFSSFTFGALDGLRVDEVVSELGMTPRQAARVARLAAPTAHEFEVLRDHIDPARSLIGRTAKR